MYLYKVKRSLWILSVIAFIIALILCYKSSATAQNWIALPPFNTLWPLWSPTLSPVDPVTGAPTPIVSELSPDTVLPVVPGITWDPALTIPYLLFNGPEGLVYWSDHWTPIQSWPPSYIQATFNIAGTIYTLPPTPLVLPSGYADLPPTSPLWLLENVPLIYNRYFYTYPIFIPYPWNPTGAVYTYNPFLQGGYYVWNIPLVNEIVAGTPYFLSAYDILGYNPNFPFITASDI
jgi:hypothetical protein